jgi:hypothetical protein
MKICQVLHSSFNEKPGPGLVSNEKAVFYTKQLFS